MLDHKTTSVVAPSVAARVHDWLNNGNIPGYVVVENLDGSASAAIKYQESDDGSSWSDISGTSKTVNPGLSDGQIVTSSKSRIALHAGGNVRLLFHVVRQVNGAPASLGAA